MRPTTLYTVGHSDRTLDELLAVLGEVDVTVLVDVRAEPRSKRHPQFNEDALRTGCGEAGVVYHWAGRHLGGMRPVRADSRHCAMDEGRRGFADHMESQTFQRAAAQLVNMAARGPTAILCAERLPERCHRALIADYLLLQGLHIVHLIAPGERRSHLLSPEARRESAALVYDRQVTANLDLD